jgi:vancomycin resistance protein VanJ
MLRRVLLAAFVAVAGAYGLNLTLFLMLRAVVGERWGIIALFNTYLLLLLIPPLVLLPLCFVVRKRWLALTQLPAVMLFLSTFGGLFLPRSVAAPPDAPRFTVLTYNLHAEQNLLAPMAAVIRQADADIVALQEMSAAASAYFASQLADRYPYRALHPASSPYHGRGILSRFPITLDRAWPEEYPIPVRLQRVELSAQDQTIVLYNFHAPPSAPIFRQGFNFRPRAQQIQMLLDLAAQEDGPLLLLGDFNTGELNENYERITARYSDVWRQVGWGMGFTNPDWSHENSHEGPAFFPLHNRIDYMFHDSAFQAVEARVWPESGGSDHRPLWARLALVGKG